MRFLATFKYNNNWTFEWITDELAVADWLEIHEKEYTDVEVIEILEAKVLYQDRSRRID